MSDLPGPCPTAEELEGIAAGGPAPENVQAHLAACGTCRDALERMRANNQFLQEFAAGGALPEIAPRDVGRPVAIPGYDFIREVHHGGQGVVHLAVQRATKRRVAIKLMKQGPFATMADRARFEREIDTLSRLNHPNIVAVHDAGVVEGNHYIVMDYIEGEPLDEALPGMGTRIGGEAGQGARGDERLIRAGLETFITVCAAVHAAHLRGVIHRDLKPSNIRVDATGTPHVLDFGLAKSLTDEDDLTVTRTGQFVGSLPWASPEQVEGNAARIDLRTDVYSLGAMLFQLLTGALPFDVDSGLRSAVANILDRPAPAPSVVGSVAADLRIGDELDTIVLKCLAKDRERRYQSAGELARDLRRCLVGEAIEAKRDSAIYVLRKTLRRYRMRVAAAGAFVALLGIFAIVMVVLYRQAAHLERAAVDSATSLTRLLSKSNIEQGRMVGILGNMQLAEQLLWRELLTQRDARSNAITLRTPPGPPEAYWALWELYRHYPCLRTMFTGPLHARTATLAENGTDVWVAEDSGHIARISPDGAVRESFQVDALDGPGVVLTNARGNWGLRLDKDGCQAWRRTPDTGAVEDHLAAPGGAVYAVAISRQRTRAAAIIDGEAVILDFPGARPIARFAGDEAPLTAAALSNDDRRIAARDTRGNLFIWDLATQRLTTRAAGNEPRPDDLHPLGELVFSPDGRYLADGWVDLPGRIWDLAVDPPRAISLSERPGEYRTHAFSPDGTRLAIGDHGGALWIFDVASGRKLTSFVAHAARLRSVFFTSDGQGVWTCADDGLRLWEVASDAAIGVVRVAGEHLHGVDISPDGRWITAGGSEGVVHLIDAATLGRASIAFGNDRTVSSVASSPDGKWLAAGVYTRAAYLWDTDHLDAEPLYLEHASRVSYVCFSADSTMLAAAGDSGVSIWRVADGERLYEWSTTDRVPQVAFDPAGRRLAIAMRDGSLHVREIATGESATWQAATYQPVRAVCFTPDGGRLISAGADRVVRIWDAATGQCVGTLVGHNQEIFCATVSPGGALIASGDSSGTIRLWDASSGAPLASLEGHTEAVMALEFSHDNRKLISASLDGTVRIWDLTYYSRNIAGNLDAQIKGLPGVGSDAAGVAAWRQWAAGL
ncbi:MAG: protein kinase [Phycisphaerales bacterium]|nr:protein kinase [Phycisphaerales bacterium]